MPETEGLILQYTKMIDHISPLFERRIEKPHRWFRGRERLYSHGEWIFGDFLKGSNADITAKVRDCPNS